MTKLLATLGLLSALALPAAAQGVFDNSASANEGRGAMQSDMMTDQSGMQVDTTTTGSISSTNSQDEGTQVQRGNQGNVFGANGD